MPVLLQKHRVRGMVTSVYSLLLLVSPLAAQEFERGQALYENHCRSCHESWAHTREGRHVRTVSELAFDPRRP